MKMINLIKQLINLLMTIYTTNHLLDSFLASMVLIF